MLRRVRQLLRLLLWMHKWLMSVYLHTGPPNIAKFPFLQELFRDARRTVFLAVVRHPIALLRKRFFGLGQDQGDDSLTEATAKYTTKSDLAMYFDYKMSCWSVTVQACIGGAVAKLLMSIDGDCVVVVSQVQDSQQTPRIGAEA